jgi:hypothetical protein
MNLQDILDMELDADEYLLKYNYFTRQNIIDFANYNTSQLRLYPLSQLKQNTILYDLNQLRIKYHIKFV